jgi:uncharacterized membrane protein YhaH (DUF805 family)
MNFLDSIKTCLFKKYAEPSGRASRSEYWFFMLFVYSIFILAALSKPILFKITPQDPFSTVKDWSIYVRDFLNLFYLLIAIPYLTATTRRLHDIGLGPAFIFFTLLFWFFYHLLLLFQLGYFLGMISANVGNFLQIIVFILCLKKGDKKKNKFGPPVK